MQSFPVSDDVVSHVWKLAGVKPFEQISFNDALRRVLAIPRLANPVTSPSKTGEELLAELEAMPSGGGRVRAPKADLRELVRLGYLTEGQELTFVDYKGKRYNETKAVVADGRLRFNKRTDSMSALAGVLLNAQGFSGESVRGPDHWATSDGTLIRELWTQVLSKRGK